MLITINHTSVSEAIEEWLAKRWINPPKVLDTRITSVGAQWYLTVELDTTHKWYLTEVLSDSESEA